jgi:hypothetical protein
VRIQLGPSVRNPQLSCSIRTVGGGGEASSCTINADYVCQSTEVIAVLKQARGGVLSCLVGSASAVGPESQIRLGFPTKSGSVRHRQWWGQASSVTTEVVSHLGHLQQTTRVNFAGTFCVNRKVTVNVEHVASLKKGGGSLYHVTRHASLEVCVVTSFEILRNEVEVGMLDQLLGKSSHHQ